MRKVLIVLLAVALLVGLAAPAAATGRHAKPTVTVLIPFALDSPDAEALEAELAKFGRNWLEIVYEEYFGADDLIERVNGPEPPDLIITPQPATLITLQDSLEDLSRFVWERRLRRSFGDYLIDVASVDGDVLGVPIKADLKSLVWYRPDRFAVEGYSIPETYIELLALSDGMVADGHTPWCNYIESGFATGWMGTDWVEDLLLGAEGPEVYDQWVDHDVLFVDPRVETAFEEFMDLMDTDGYVYDRPNLTNVFFFANAAPLGDGDCFMHKQASFFGAAITDFGYDLEDFSTFKFPSLSTEFSDSALGAGAYVAALNKRLVVRLLVRFMVNQRFGRTALADVGWIMPNVKFKLKHYGDELTRSFAEVVRDAIKAGQFRFDASDLMPPEVGTAEFWFGMRDLLDGVRTIPQVLQDIDDAWPS